MSAQRRRIPSDSIRLPPEDCESRDVNDRTTTRPIAKRHPRQHPPIGISFSRIRLRLHAVLLMVLLSCLTTCATAAAAASEQSSSTPPRKPYRSTQPQTPPPPMDLPPQHDHEVIRQLVQDLTSRMSMSSAMAGKFGRIRANVFRVVSKQEMYLVYKCLAAANVQWQDLLLLTALGFLPVPLLKSLMPLPSESMHRDGRYYDAQPTSAADYNLPSSLAPPSASSTRLPFMIARNIQQLAQIALLVHAVDILQMLAIGLGYFEFDGTATTDPSRSLSQFLCTTLYAAWATQKASHVTQWLVRRNLEAQRRQMIHPVAFPSHRSLASRRLEQLAGVTVYAVAVLGYLFWNVASNWSRIAGGLTSLPAFVALGTVLLGSLGFVSVQSVLQQIWSGCLLATRLCEGDVVQVGDVATADADTIHGMVTQLGWTDTVIRCFDDSFMTIPNHQLWKQRVNNLSQATHSQVRQSLQFQYREAHKLPSLLKSIKDEIRLACPSVVTDGSLPFRAHWTSFGQEYLQVEVEAHFQISLQSSDYWDNRQRVLQAINRAIKIHQVELAVRATPLVRPLGSAPGSSSSQHYFAASSARVTHSTGSSNAGRSQ